MSRPPYGCLRLVVDTAKGTVGVRRVNCGLGSVRFYELPKSYLNDTFSERRLEEERNFKAKEKDKREEERKEKQEDKRKQREKEQ